MYNAPQRQLSPDPRVSGQYSHPALVLLWALVTDIFEAWARQGYDEPMIKTTLHI